MPHLPAILLFVSLYLLRVSHAAPRQAFYYGGDSFFGRLAKEEKPKGNEWEKSGFFEGDIMVNTLFRNGKLCSGNSCRWTHKTVPYKIDKSFGLSQRAAIKEAFDEYHRRTCIKFRPATEDDIDYVNIVDSPYGCSSYVGRQGGAQNVNLRSNHPGEGCFKHGTIVHELLHALGFHHQHSTTDRDDYVKIIWDNIIKGHEHNFKKYPESKVTSYGVKYDYDSVMHYSSLAFSKNGEDTIIPLSLGATIGQRDELSDKDIEKLHLMYECPAPTDSSEERR